MNTLLKSFLLALLGCSTCMAAGKFEINGIDMTKVEYEHFRNPDREFRGVRFIGLGLGRTSEEQIRQAVQRDFATDKWGSFVLIADGGSTEGLTEDYLKFSGRKASDQGIAYLSEEYFKVYRAAIEEGLKLGFNCTTLYDEWTYPSGIVEGLYYSKYPNDCSKTLEMEEQDAEGVETVTLTMPENGIYIGSVLMNLDSYICTDISKSFKSGTLTYKTGKGRWKVMLFWLDYS